MKMGAAATWRLVCATLPAPILQGRDKPPRKWADDEKQKKSRLASNGWSKLPNLPSSLRGFSTALTFCKRD